MRLQSTELGNEGGSFPMSEVIDLLRVRQMTHGRFADTSRLAQATKELWRTSPNWNRLSPVKREALEMRATKIARILCGDPSAPDHWADDEGYAELCDNDGA
jgi:hypothetical protein